MYFSKVIRLHTHVFLLGLENRKKCKQLLRKKNLSLVNNPMSFRGEVPYR